MNGKSKCKLLKDIRKQIAESNDIAYVTSECKFQGDCTGTCPKCEAEVRYLEQELHKRKQLGKSVAVAGVAAALVVSMSACDLGDSTTPPVLSGDVQIIETEPQPTKGLVEPSQDSELLLGEIPVQTDSSDSAEPEP